MLTQSSLFSHPILRPQLFISPFANRTQISSPAHNPRASFYRQTPSFTYTRKKMAALQGTSLKCSSFLGMPARVSSAVVPRTGASVVRSPTQMAQKLLGVVKSTKMEQSAVVVVTRKYPHPKYKKLMRKTKNYIVHDPTESTKEGDYVQITPICPLSKNKRFEVAEIIRRGK